MRSPQHTCLVRGCNRRPRHRDPRSTPIYSDGGSVPSATPRSPGWTIGWRRCPAAKLPSAVSSRWVETVGVSDARKLYDSLTDDLLYDPAVGRSTMMGYPCMRRGGHFFASFDTGSRHWSSSCRGRVSPAELVADGTGEPFAPNGRGVPRWVTAPEPDPDVWERLLAEARGSPHPPSVRRRRTTGSWPTGFAWCCPSWVSMMYASRGCLAVSAFLVGGHIAVAASREGGVLVSVDVSNSDALLSKPHTRPMVMRGREMAGWLRVDPDGLRTKRQLIAWVNRGVDRARAQPPAKGAARRAVRSPRSQGR